jgi:hypothetical protein
MMTSHVGRWRIVEMDQWDRDYIDMDSPGYMAFKKGGRGQIHFGCVEAELDWRIEETKAALRELGLPDDIGPA